MEIYGRFCGVFRKIEDYSSKDSKKVKEIVFKQSLT